MTPLEPLEWSCVPSEPQVGVMSTYLWPLIQGHNLAGHSNPQALGLFGCVVLLKHDAKFLITRLWEADFGQDVRAGAMKVIDTSIKGDIVDTSIGHAATTARGMTTLDAILYSTLLMGPAVFAIQAADLATWPTLTASLTLRARVEGRTQWVVAAIVEAAALAHGHAGVTAKHEASITDTALTAGGLTALRC